MSDEKRALKGVPQHGIKELQTKLAEAEKVNAAMSTELQRVMAFANDRTVQIYAQAYLAAIAANHPDPNETATGAVRDLNIAFGMQQAAPAANN